MLYNLLKFNGNLSKGSLQLPAAWPKNKIIEIMYYLLFIPTALDLMYLSSQDTSVLTLQSL